MKTIDVIQGGERRNERLRLLMLLIIAGTVPFYCLAILLIGSAPVAGYRARASDTAAPAASVTPLGADMVLSPRASAGPPRQATITPLSLPRDTPAQFVPPSPIPVTAPPTPLSPSPTATDEPTPRPTATPGIGDADFDGTLDDVDNCPEEYGAAENAGCPWLDDPDRDGLRGDADLCPNEFAPDTVRGCRDFDDDGLDTSQDDCPAQAGTIANRGCPPQ